MYTFNHLSFNPIAESATKYVEEIELTKKKSKVETRETKVEGTSLDIISFGYEFNIAKYK